MLVVRLIEGLVIYILYNKWCHTMELWFPFTGRVFFEKYGTNEYGSVSRNPDGRHTPVYIVSM